MGTHQHLPCAPTALCSLNTLVFSELTTDLVQVSLRSFLGVIRGKMAKGSRQMCVTNCDQGNKVRETASRLCATNQSSGDRQEQPCRGSGCSGFVLDTGKKVRKDEQLSSKRDAGFYLFLAKLLADTRWKQGWSG